MTRLFKFRRPVEEPTAPFKDSAIAAVSALTAIPAVLVVDFFYKHWARHKKLRPS